MLNSNGIRELAYVVQVDAVKPIDGYDRIAYATVNGWHCVVGKDIKAGDLAVYFEIDSLLPSDDQRFAFTEKYGYKVKTQKYCKGTKISQGLLMPITEFPELASKTVGDFVTQELKITYYDPMDRARKTTGPTEYNTLFKKLKHYFPFKQMMRTEWGRNLLLKVFGVKKKVVEWPVFVPKTDEERIQNCTWVLKDKSPVEITEKIDGCSSTYAIQRGKHGKYKIWVCSRNCVLTRNKSAYYDTNYWYEMYDKYDIEHFLKDYLERTGAEWVYLQGETYGDGVQKRNYSLKGERDFAAFILCTSLKPRYTYLETANVLREYGIPTVPIISSGTVLPDGVEDVMMCAGGASRIDGLPREGLVFRRVTNTNESFKAVDPEFLLRFH